MLSQDSRYHCSAEWHFAHLKGRGKFLAATLYSLAFHLSKNSGVFFASIPGLADYFGVSERTVRKALASLSTVGFLQIVARPRGRAVQYCAIGHKEWQQLHPGN